MTLAVEQNRILAEKFGQGFDMTKAMMAMAEEDENVEFADDYVPEFEEVKQ